MFKIDLHTHSTASDDGGITQDQYMTMLEDGTLDYVAVTDHNSIKMAQKLHELIGDKIIIGEEIMTTQGEIIGLFLTQQVKPGQSLKATISDIKKQRGLVYVPHPFETVRSGITKEHLDKIIDDVHIVESYNGRAVFQNKGPEATVWARVNQKAIMASSDAHGLKGVGSAYAVVRQKPTVHNLTEQLYTAHLTMRRPPIHTLLYPKTNRLKNKLRRHG